MAAPAIVRRRPNVAGTGYAPLRPIEGRPAQGSANERARRFVARLSNTDAMAAEAIDAPDFMQAALLFAETCAGCEAGELSVAVSDAETGETHCFVLNLAD